MTGHGSTGGCFLFRTFFALLFLHCLTVSVPAVTRHVWTNSPYPGEPYNAWSNASHDIQTAVNAATNAGDVVLVTNGVYGTGGAVTPGYSATNRVCITNEITVQSVNGPEHTFIVGAGPNGVSAVRCVYMAGGPMLIGFTLTNGYTRTSGDQTYDRSGGGVLAPDGLLSNCMVTGNSANRYGGGSHRGTLNHCTLVGNSAAGGGGSYEGTLNNCVLSGNSASSGGGSYDSTLYNCTLSGNSADSYGGGNRYGTLNNCTLSGNSADYGGGSWGGTLNNCIVYYNKAHISGDNRHAGTYSYCCTSPDSAEGVGNITNAPMLLNTAHIHASSPCVGAGSASYASGVDIDGNAWADPPAMGCDQPVGPYAGPLAVTIEAPHTNVAVGYSLALHALIERHPSSNLWTFGDGDSLANHAYAWKSWDETGAFTVVCAAYNDDSPGGVSATVEVQVVERPVHYVWTNSPDPDPPYADWQHAASTIQEAVDASSNVWGSLVLVTDGVYQAGSRVTPGYSLANRVVITHPVTVESVNGPSNTFIVGAGPNGNAAVRCLYVDHGGLLHGFTLTNGHTRTSGDNPHDRAGGGVLAADGVLSNCIITGNSADSTGGGSYLGTLNNCTLSGNSAGASGGGIYYGTLNNCTVAGNSANWAGGSFFGTLNNCALLGNSAVNTGGGSQGGTLNNCTLSGNSANDGGGVYGGTLNNCTLSGNSATNYGGGTYGGTLNNCTLAGNFAADRGGGSQGGTLNNCIVRYNTAPSGSNHHGGAFAYSCATPVPGGSGNIAGPPQFVDLAASNYHLQATSPCIDSGNNAYAPGTHDLDGVPRIVDGDLDGTNTVDMGAYEYVGDPVVTITTPPGPTLTLFGEYDTFDVAGTNNAWVVGTMWWTNAAAGSGGEWPVSGVEWQVLDVPLEFGDNVITVFGTNYAGATTSDTVTITRLVEHGTNSPVHYVSTNAANIYPYTNWATAAHVLQDAVDTASAGDLVLVTNGVYDTGGMVTPGYSLTNRVCILRAVTVQSVNGPSNTFIVGVGPKGNSAVRGVYMSAGVLSGFTLTNGHTMTSGDSRYDQSGGGINMYAGNGVVSNCTLRGNSATFWGGGSAYGTLNNCTLSGNLGGGGGGGSYHSTLNHCMLFGNSANDGGGSYAGTLNNCTLSGNSAGSVGGGCADASAANCTISGNSAGFGGSGAFSDFDGAGYDSLTNCIVFGNTPDDIAGNWVAIRYTCSPGLAGDGNITNDPLFVDATSSNFHLQIASPCIDAGTNLAVIVDDLDGIPRPLDGDADGSAIHDMGAYEYFGDPVVTITNPPGPTVSVFGEMETFYVAGTNNPWVVGTMWWTNAASGGTGAFAASNEWQVGVPLVLGENPVAVFGTNQFGSTGSHSVTITRLVEHGPNSPIHYVWTNSPSEAWPYTNWNMAAHVLQDAVDAASAGDTVMVTDGVYDTGGAVTPGYALSNRVCITRAIDVESVNGLSNTFIVGVADPVSTNGPAAVRGVYMVTNSSLTGFTVTGGHTRANGDGNYAYDQCGGGLMLDRGGTVSNCVFSGNSAFVGGGAECFRGGLLIQCTIADNFADFAGGVYCLSGGELNGCTVSGNSSIHGGGGVRCANSGLVIGCTISSNSAFNGGGAFLLEGGLVVGSTLSSNSAYNGGGVYINLGGTVSNCTLSGNSAYAGGGAHCYSNGLVTQCTLSDNSAAFGGGAYFNSGGELNDCTLSGNTGTNGGGGVRCQNGGLVIGCTISSNSADNGGGAFCTEGSMIIGSTLSSNNADNGGAVYCASGGTVSNCTLSGNSANAGGALYLVTGGTVEDSMISGSSADSGGGVVCQQGGTLNRCTFSMNSATNSGGGAYLNQTGTLNNCLFTDNSAYIGGGVICINGGTLNNCTLADNSAGDDGGGVRTQNGGTLNNCVVWMNQAVSGGNDIYVVGSGEIFRHTCSSEGVTDGVDGCTTNPPLFIDAAGADYRLSYGSPCIDGGTNTYAFGTIDLDGLPRVGDGDGDATITVDMGAYEYDGTTYDSDRDGLVDDDELLLTGTSPTNTNSDGDSYSDYEEYIADTSGTDSNDYFHVMTVSKESPFTVYFESSSNRVYTMVGLSNLVVGISSNVPGAGPRLGVGGEDSMQDTNAPVAGPFYWLKVQLPPE